MSKQQESFEIKALLRKHGYSVRGVRHGTGASLSIINYPSQHNTARIDGIETFNRSIGCTTDKPYGLGRYGNLCA